MEKRVMIDLETLGNRPGSVIVSLGAVEFDYLGFVSYFYERIDVQSCVDLGMTMDTSTIMWWLNQEKETREELAKPGLPLNEVLLKFSAWLGTDKDTEVWGNGATFDNVLLSCAYEKARLPRPWSYKGDRCYRTIKSLFSKTIPAPIFEGIKHNALDDAKNQAAHLRLILKTLNI
jgi:hypothetical protein